MVADLPTITLGRPATPSVAGTTVKALGTFCSVLVAEPPALAEATRILSGELAAIDLACSRFRPDSELSKVNRAGGAPTRISPLFARAIEVGLRAAEITAGDVDPTCGAALIRLGYDRDFSELADAELASRPLATTRTEGPSPDWRCVTLDPSELTVRLPAGVKLDLGATAKALAADLAASRIHERLGCGVLVNLGGDIAIAGPPPDGGWRIGVSDGVDDPEGAAWGRPGAGPVIAVEAGGVTTSCPTVRSWRRGDRRLHHIVVPGTGQPAEIYWSAVTVAAATCVDANIASTAAIIRGRSAPAWLAELGLPARLARPDGLVLTTGGWPN